MDKFPYAEHLNLEEVDYELLIRGVLDEKIAALDLPSKQRYLRTLFKADLKNLQNYPSPYSISEEYDHINGRITDLVSALERCGLEQRFVSRLLHYYYRAKRCLADQEGEALLKRNLVRRIGECMKGYKIGPPASEYVEKINDVLNEADGSRSGQTGQFPNSSTPKATGTVPKVAGMTPKDQVPNDTTGGLEKDVHARMNHMERMIESVTKMLTEREPPIAQTGGTAEHQRVVAARNPIGTPNRTTPNISTEEDELFGLLKNVSRLLKERQGTQQVVGQEPEREMVRSRLSGLFGPVEPVETERAAECGREQTSRHYEVAQEQQRAMRNTRERDDSDDSDGGSFASRRREGFQRRGQDHDDRRARGRDYGMRDHLNRVEKWKLRFSGDSRSVTVENFLYKLNKIAELEGVPERQLLRDIHLLLEGPASDWFFTFVDEFEDWPTFERLIKFRFGNPNQDQGIRQRIQERKQQRGESFIAFVTEIEKLNRMLSKPLSRTRKFEFKLCASLRATTDYDEYESRRKHLRGKITSILSNHEEEIGKVVKLDRKYLD
ncbi:uncharacterized protein LOC134285198 [Aedes albopictus]|uniref:Retrotransposon gag domain-containing protein n=1 Tax=Aedes albopictus TaxID=7160 RepID=A0ABM1YCR2_AEDAL